MSGRNIDQKYEFVVCIKLPKNINNKKKKKIFTSGKFSGKIVYIDHDHEKNKNFEGTYKRAINKLMSLRNICKVRFKFPFFYKSLILYNSNIKVIGFSNINEN